MTFGHSNCNNFYIIFACIFLLTNIYAFPVSKYSMWTWLSGNDTSLIRLGNYGEKGVPSIDNYPAGRENTIIWIDEENQVLYLFGGQGYDGNDSTTVPSALNDLWSYSIETNEWTWLSGSISTKERGNYGEKGKPSIDNIPGARYGSVSWMDKENKLLYLFGGFGKSEDHSFYTLNDVWSYSIETNLWTWLSGSTKNSENGRYGEKGKPSIDNIPGARHESASWFDKENNVLYLFGGLGLGEEGNINGNLNDLWSYSIETNEWTWLSGSRTDGENGNHGEKGKPSIDNIPGGRYGSVSWFDKENNMLYLFGGIGEDENFYVGNLNELWSYSIETKEWTWLSGTNIRNQNSNYGEKGVPSIDNYPGSTVHSVSWIDKENDMLYFFGGNGYDDNSITSGHMNSIWSYSLKTNKWTWVAGSNKYNVKGNFGEKGKRTSSNYPGARTGSALTYDEKNNVLYLFGGYGYNTYYLDGMLNDLWSFSIFEREPDTVIDEPEESGIKNSIMNNVSVYLLFMLSLHLLYFA